MNLLAELRAWEWTVRGAFPSAEVQRQSCIDPAASNLLSSTDDELNLRQQLACCRVAASDEVESRENLLDAIARLAEYMTAHGGFDEAEALQQEGKQLATALAAATASPFHQYAIATAVHGLGTIAQGRGDLATAEGCYQHAFAERGRLAAIVPTPCTRAGVADSSDALGRVLLRLGRFPDARCRFAEAQRIYGELAIEGSDREHAIHAVDATREIARLEEDLEEFAAAERHLRAAIGLLQLLIEGRDQQRWRTRLADAHADLGHLLQQTGQLDEAEASYQRGMDAYAALAAGVDGAVYTQRHARMLQRLAGIANARGQMAVAEARYREALALLQPRARGEWRASCAEVLCGLASNLGDRGRLDEAGKLLREAAALLRAEGGGAIDAEAQDQMAWVALELGMLQRDRGDFEAAEAHYLHALRLREQIAATGGDPRSLDLLAHVRRGFGLFLLRRQRLDEAEAMFGSSHAGYRELLRTGDLPAHRASLAKLAAHLGSVAEERGRFDVAVAHHREAVGLLEPLLATSNGVQHCRELASLLSDLGSCLQRAGRLDEAAQALSRARELLHSAANDGPDSRRSIARIEWKSAGLARRRGASELAEARYQTALSAYEQLAMAAGDVASRRSLALLCGEVAMFRHLAQDPAGALQHLERARELWTALIAAGDTPELRGYLAETIALQGKVAAGAGEQETAERRLREALALTQAIAEQVDDDAARMQLAERHVDLAVFCEDHHRLDEAEAGYLRAHTLYSALASDNRKRKPRAGLARVCQDLGDVARARGDFATAAIRYQEAIDGRAALTRDFGDADSAQDHARARQRFAEFLLDRGQATAALEVVEAAIQQLAACSAQTDTELQCDSARSLCTAAAANAGLARYDDAEACYRRALAAMQTTVAASPSRWGRLELAGVLEEFADFLQERGQGEEAMALRAREALLREQLDR